MIINKIVVIYYFLLLVSLAVGLTGGWAAFSSLARWRRDQGLEGQNAIEERFYLCTAAISVGACLRLVMLPIWFSMLQGLIPVIPGAMCLSGVHQNVPVYSWLASGMKLLLPLFYMAWLAVSRIDRKLSQQPFLRFRHLLVIPILALLLAETFLDLKFLTALRPVPVPCCTALFDMATGTSATLFATSHWYFVWAFLAVLAGQLLLLALAPGSGVRFGLTALGALALLILLPLALHTRLSPLLLGTPFHHCVFCLLQNRPLALAGSILILIGTYVSFAYGVVGGAAAHTNALALTTPFLARLKRLAIIFLTVGMLILTLPTIQTILNQGGNL